MSGLYSQLLLHSEAQDNNAEATCLALCQVASKLFAEVGLSFCQELYLYGIILFR